MAYFTYSALAAGSLSSAAFPLLAPNGSAAAPSYSFANSTGLGLYRSGTNILGFSTAGISAGTIDASQLWYLGGSGATFISGLAGKMNINRDMTDFTTHLICTETQSTISGNTALTGGSLFRSAIEATIYRQVSSGTISDNFGFYAAITGRLNFAINGGTYTTNSDVVSALLAATSTVTGGGTKTITNLAGLHVQADSQSNITRKIGIYLGGPTAATNNAYISDNVSFTGSYGLCFTGSSKHLLTGPTAIGGTTTNDSASAGFVGEYIESVVSSYTNIPGATTVWGNMTSISLTAGDWDVTGIMNWIANGATITAGIDQEQIAISVNSGATTSDHVQGSNQINMLSPSASTDRGAVISNYRISLSATTTVYFKMLVTYSVATPQYKCRLSARRVR